MRKGMLKLLLLKTIAKEKEKTGYDLMKKVERLTGRKPSTGTIYPMLRSMESEGWIESEKRDGKVFYHISPEGSKKLEELSSLRREHMRKVMEMLSIAEETFEEEPPEDDEYIELFFPLIGAIHKLRKKGVSPEKIRPIVDRAKKKLEELEAEK